MGTSASALTVQTLAWMNSSFHVIHPLPLAEDGHMDITPEWDALMRAHHLADPFQAGSSYCTVRVQRTVGDHREVIEPVQSGIKTVEGKMFYMYEFESVFDSPLVRLEAIQFNVDSDCIWYG